MSGYDRNTEQYVYDAEATRPNQLPTYTGIAQPSFASQYTDAPARLSHESPNLEAFVPSSTYESRAPAGYQAESSYIDARSRHSASHTVTESEITKHIAPSQGTAGSIVILHLRTSFDLAADQTTFVLMFYQKECVAAMQKIEQDDEFYSYALSVDVPPFPLTNAFDPTMMLKLRMKDKNGRLLNEIDAGKFTYTDMSPSLVQSSPELSRKRKYSTDFADAQEYSERAMKRSNTMRFQAKPRSMSGAYSAVSLSPLPTQPSLSGTYPYTGGYDLSKQSSYTPQMPQKPLYAVPSGMSLPQTDMKPPQVSPSLPSYNQHSSLSQSGRSPASFSATPSLGNIMSSPSALPTPVLVRATTQGASAGQPFNPYAMYPTKAVLKIEGDLDQMAENWTQEETNAKRRLVEFKRSQHGSTITTSFAPVTPEARPPRSICVSCIYWEEKDACYITSVDTIYLLEQLVNVRFTVEEKNRIRRNLEGFRPLTVSKAKSDSEEFFKVIMGFPNPKPRNIEKDVKVFPWKILSHALKKIISKYTASYSSTAGAGSLPIGSTSNYVQPGVAHTTGDTHRNTSPRSVASTTAYTPSMTSTSLSPHMKVSAGLEGSAGHSVSVPHRGLAGQGMTQWEATTHHQIPQYTASLPQGGRETWDYHYLSASGPGVPSAAQSMQMQRSDVTPDLRGLPPDNPYQQHGQRTTRV